MIPSQGACVDGQITLAPLIGFAIVVAKSSMEIVLARVDDWMGTLAAVLVAVAAELVPMAAVFVSVATSVTGTPPPIGRTGRNALDGRSAHPTTGTIRIQTKSLTFLLTVFCPLFTSMLLS
jgi:hypothetical protein